MQAGECEPRFEDQQDAAVEQAAESVPRQRHGIQRYRWAALTIPIVTLVPDQDSEGG
jgi:hypothetical protein